MGAGLAAIGLAGVGDGLTSMILVGTSHGLWWRAQQQKVDHRNVYADGDDSTNSVVPVEVREPVPGAPVKDIAAV